jgi:hypothetical protein
MSPGDSEPLRAGRADQHRGNNPRRLLQRDPGELDVGPAHGHRLAGEELADRRGSLAERRQTPSRQRADLHHPLRHPRDRASLRTVPGACD